MAKITEKLHDMGLTPSPYQIYQGASYIAGYDVTFMAVDVPCGGVLIRGTDYFSDVRSAIFQHMPDERYNNLATDTTLVRYSSQASDYLLAFVTVNEVDVTLSNGYKAYGYAVRAIHKNITTYTEDTLTYIYGTFDTLPQYYRQKAEYIPDVGSAAIYYYLYGSSISYTYAGPSGNVSVPADVRTAINEHATSPHSVAQNGWDNHYFPTVFYVYDTEDNYVGSFTVSLNILTTSSRVPNLIIATGGLRKAAPSEWTEIAGNTLIDESVSFRENGTSVSATITSVDGMYYSGLSLVEAEEPEEGDKDMFTSMVDLWDIDSDNLARLKVALQNATETNDPILNSIAALRIVKTPNVDWDEETSTSVVFNYTQVNNNISSTINAKKLNNQFKTFTVGSYTLTEHFKNFLDYPPYTKIYLFLPFIGLTELDGNLCMGKTITVRCSIDAYSGDITYEVRSGGDTGSGLPLSTYTANASIELPIVSRVNQSYKEALAIMSTASSSAAKVVGGVSQLMPGGGGPGAAISEIASAADTAVQGGLSVYQTMRSGGYNDIKAERGNLNASHGWNTYTQPYIMIIRPKDAADDNYSTVNGLPTMKSKKLSDCSGFTQVVQPELTGISGTAAELKEIRNALVNGVVI